MAHTSKLIYEDKTFKLWFDYWHECDPEKMSSAYRIEVYAQGEWEEIPLSENVFELKFNIMFPRNYHAYKELCKARKMLEPLYKELDKYYGNGGSK